MSPQSQLSLSMTTLLLLATFLLMPFLLSDLAPKAGITSSAMSVWLGIANAIAAISLYIRPRFSSGKRLVLFLSSLLFLSLMTVHVGLQYTISSLLIFGVVVLRVVLVNFSDLNRQVHMQTNTQSGMKHALTMANVISNIISCAVPVLASFLIFKFGGGGVTYTAILACLVIFIFVWVKKSELNLFDEVSIDGRSSLGEVLTRFKSNVFLYLFVLVIATVFAFILSFIPLTINTSTSSSLDPTFMIGGYFAINSIVIALGSFPLLKILERYKISDFVVISVASILSLLSIFVLIFFDGQWSILAISSVLMAFAEIVFIPHLVSLISIIYINQKEELLKDVTLISVSVSAVVAAPLAGVLIVFGNSAIIAFLLAASLIIGIGIFKIKGEINGQGSRNRRYQ